MEVDLAYENSINSGTLGCEIVLACEVRNSLQDSLKPMVQLIFTWNITVP